MLNLTAIAARIKKIRGKLSQREFAVKLNFKQTYISEIETAKTKPSLDFLLAMRMVYGVSLDFIISGEQIVCAPFHDPIYLAIADFSRKVKEIQEIHGLEVPISVACNGAESQNVNRFTREPAVV